MLTLCRDVFENGHCLSSAPDAAPTDFNHSKLRSLRFDENWAAISEVRNAADNSNPRVLVEKASNAFTMNDIMMEEVFREEKPDEVECVIEVRKGIIQ